MSDLAASTIFPGRVRQFAAPDPGQALALAAGCAWCESRRDGYAVAVVPDDQRSRPLVRAALALAARLGLDNLVLRPQADPTLAIEPLVARERQPVRLASLGRDLVPHWPASDHDGILTWLAQREPMLLLPDRDPRWGGDEATLLALAWIAGDGRRVAWVPPPDADPGAWTSALDLIGRMQLPLKLLLPAARLPWPPDQRGLGRWWVADAGGSDGGGVLAWALAGEESCALAIAPSPLATTFAWTPGEALVLATGTKATLLCTAADAAAATAAAAATGCAALQLTGLIPLPLPALRTAAARGPLLALGEDLARHLAGLAALDPELHVRLAPCDACGAALAVRQLFASGLPV